MKTICIIPVFNEKGVESIVQVARTYVDTILIIDDGSTLPIKIDGCTVIRNKGNKGKGYSLRRGIKYATGFDKIIFMDGDGEHNPHDIPKFLKQSEKFIGLIIGKRKRYRSFFRMILNKWTDFWIKQVISIRDFNCGFKLIDKKSIDKLKFESNGFEIDIEMVLKCIENKVKIKSVTISINIRKKSKVKFKDYIKINNFFDKWIIKNHKNLNISGFKRNLLLLFAKIGLFIGRFLIVFVNIIFFHLFIAF